LVHPVGSQVTVPLVLALGLGLVVSLERPDGFGILVSTVVDQQLR
jgi:hypothetical protein